MKYKQGVHVNKFILKYLILFVTVISLMFFSLTFFQSYTMAKEREQFEKMQPNPQYDAFNDFGMPPMPQMPPQSQKEPPSYIPLLLIIIVSSTLLYFILRYIDKNFVEPLTLIEKNVEKIKDGSLDVEFKTRAQAAVFAIKNNLVD